MIHTAFLTDYTNRIYTLPSAHNTLKLFLSLCPGSEIMTAVYDQEPSDFQTNWFNYKFKNSDRYFHLLEDDHDFKNLSIKINGYLDLWKDVISKLNFIYDKESNPFKFNKHFDEKLLETLRQCQQRCEEIIIDNFNSGNVKQAKYNIDRETFNNILL
jgi:hypothetical protein